MSENAYFTPIPQSAPSVQEQCAEEIMIQPTFFATPGYGERQLEIVSLLPGGQGR